MKKTIFKTFVATLVSSLTVFIFYLAVKAALPTANTGDKLTASKWNDLISKVNTLETSVNNSKRVDVSTSDTSLFDTTCDRRRYSGLGNIFYLSQFRPGDGSLLLWSWPTNTVSPYLVVKYTDKKNIYQRDQTTIRSSVTKIQKKCTN